MTSLYQAFPATLFVLRVFLVHVAHTLGADVQCQTDSELSVLHVATALHNVLLLQVEGDWAVYLLEESTEKAEVVVLPLYLA